MRAIIISSILLITLFFSCENKDGVLMGKWVNVNFNSKENYFTYDFKEAYVYCSKKESTEKKEWDIVDNYVLIGNANEFIKYELIVLNNDEILLNRSNEDESIFLIKKDKFQPNSDFKEQLGKSTWNYEVLADEDYNQQFLINQFELINRNEVMNYFVLKDSSSFIKIWDFEHIYHEGVNVVKMNESFEIFYYFMDSNDNDLTALLPQKIGSYSLVKFSATHSNTADVNILKNNIEGDWVAVDSDNSIKSISFNNDLDIYIMERDGTEFFKEGSFNISPENKLIILFGDNSETFEIFSIKRSNSNTLVLNGLSNHESTTHTFKRVSPLF